MRISERVDGVGIAAVAIAMATYFLVVTSRVTALGLPLDDSWIHLQFARNIGTGHGFAFNPGVPSSGSTAPLWTLLLAIPALFRIDLPMAARVLGVALTISAALLAGQVVRELTRSRLAATMTGLAVVLSARMTWASLSAMEAPLYCTLSMLTLLAYMRGLRSGRAMLWAIAAGLTATARPELFLFLPIFVAHWAWWHAKPRSGTAGMDQVAAAIRSAMAPSVVCALFIVGYVAFNYATGGRPLPGTFYAKTGNLGLASALVSSQWRDFWHLAVAQPLLYLDILFRWGDEQAPFLTMATLVGALVLAGVLPLPGADVRGGGVIVALFLLTPLLRGALVPAPPLLAQNARYISHLLIMYFMMASIGLTYLWTATRKHWAVAVFMLIAIARLASQDIKYAPRFAAEVQNINDLQIAAGEWVRAHTAPGAVVATNDIGAIAYFSGREIVDTEGLVTPEAISYKRAHTDQFVEQVTPDLLIVLPNWYPELVARTDILREVGRVTAPKIIAGGDSLVIYRMPWTRLDRVPGLPSW
jgi:hypothetical protein